MYRVTPIDTARGKCRRIPIMSSIEKMDGLSTAHPTYPIGILWYPELINNDPSLLGWVTVHYPLNGHWTDLWSDFDIYRLPDGIGLELERIER